LTPLPSGSRRGEAPRAEHGKRRRTGMAQAEFIQVQKTLGPNEVSKAAAK
jgi:hypothetical protein